MAKRFLTNIDLNSNEIQNIIIHKLATPPAGISGKIYYDTSDNKLYLHDGISWEAIGGEALTDVQAHVNTAALVITEAVPGIKVLEIKEATSGEEGLLSIAHFDDLTNATSAATPSTLVERDASGDSAFHDITVNAIVINETIDGGTPGNHGVHKDYVDQLFSTGTRIIGIIDCAGNPNYPAAVSGDMYYVGTPGKIGGAAGENVDTGDMLIAIADTAAGDHITVGANWLIVEHNIEQATEISTGVAEIATQAEVTTGTDHTRIVTPLTLNTRLSSVIAGESYAEDIGNGTLTSIAVTHSLGTSDVFVQIRDTATLEHVECDMVITDLNTVTFSFTVAPSASQLRVIIRK